MGQGAPVSSHITPRTKSLGETRRKDRLLIFSLWVKYALRILHPSIIPIWNHSFYKYSRLYHQCIFPHRNSIWYWILPADGLSRMTSQHCHTSWRRCQWHKNDVIKPLLLAHMWIEYDIQKTLKKTEITNILWLEFFLMFPKPPIMNQTCNYKSMLPRHVTR